MLDRFIGGSDSGVDYQPKGEYTSKRDVKSVTDVLDEGERAMFVIKNIAVTVAGDDSDESHKWLSAQGQRPAIAVTDRRIVVRIPKGMTKTTHSIAYHDITDMQVREVPLNWAIVLDTYRQQYEFKKVGRSKDVPEAAEYIRQQVEQERRSESPVIVEGDGNDPVEQLSKVRDLHDEGVLSDEEFEEQKRKLLDRI